MLEKKKKVRAAHEQPDHEVSWANRGCSWAHIVPANSPLDTVRDLMPLPIGRLYTKLLKNTEFGLIPLVVSCYVGQLNAESFAERVISGSCTAFFFFSFFSRAMFVTLLPHYAIAPTLNSFLVALPKSSSNSFYCHSSWKLGHDRREHAARGRWAWKAGGAAHEPRIHGVHAEQIFTPFPTTIQHVGCFRSWKYWKYWKWILIWIPVVCG